MRKPKCHGIESRWPHPGPGQRRNVISTVFTIAVAILGVSFLSSCHAASGQAGSGAGSDTHAALPADRSCTRPTVVPMNSGNAQSGVTRSKYYVTNDTWNSAPYSLSQAIYVCNYNSWYTIAAMNNDTGDGAVKTSPNVQQTWYPTPTKLSRWKSITSQFSYVPPGTGPDYGIWEFEYDIWLNGLADDKSTEIMIWTYNNGQRPAGSPVDAFYDAGHAYVVYYSPLPREYIAFVDLSQKLSGSINLLDFFNYAISKGWMLRSSTLYQICNGVELVSTNGKPEKFAINNFAIDMKPYS
jgi:hypothetical protein